MSLTEADLERLRRAGHHDFFFQAGDATLRLRNLGGRCVFLSEASGWCGVYPLRPEGCELYPLVLDAERDEATLDGFCPHRGEFSFSASQRRRLRRSIEVEDRETAARRRQGR